MQTFEGFDVPFDDPEAAAPARLVTEAFGVTMTPTVVPSTFHDAKAVQAVMRTEPTPLGAIQSAPPSSSGAVAADVASAMLLGVLSLLQVRRALECSGSPSPKQTAEWMCTTDPFASWSFVPLHGLAAVVTAAWVLLTVSGSLGQAWRCCSRRTITAPSAALLRQLEIFLAVWSLCWFAPANPFAATRDCADSDAQCTSIAACQTSGQRLVGPTHTPRRALARLHSPKLSLRPTHDRLGGIGRVRAQRRLHGGHVQAELQAVRRGGQQRLPLASARATYCDSRRWRRSAGRRRVPPRAVWAE
tara:strand:+ start:308 stop:1213 length:906 start_codon:yes stop_codon:yes gene_type:complete